MLEFAACCVHKIIDNLRNKCEHIHRACRAAGLVFEKPGIISVVMSTPVSVIVKIMNWSCNLFHSII